MKQTTFNCHARKFVVFAALDSWHIANGIHYPSPFGNYYKIYPSIEACCKAVEDYGKSRNFLMECDWDYDRHYQEFLADGREGTVLIYEITDMEDATESENDPKSDEM